MDQGADFIVERDLRDLVARMNELAGAAADRRGRAGARGRARDREIDNAFGKDPQVTAIRGARKYLGDRLIRTAKPHRMLDPDGGAADRRAAARSSPARRSAASRPTCPRAC